MPIDPYEAHMAKVEAEMDQGWEQVADMVATLSKERTMAMLRHFERKYERTGKFADQLAQLAMKEAVIRMARKRDASQEPIPESLP